MKIHKSNRNRQHLGKKKTKNDKKMQRTFTNTSQKTKSRQPIPHLPFHKPGLNSGAPEG